MFTVFLCTYRVLCSSVHQYIQFVFFVAFAFGGGGKREEGGGRREEGVGRREKREGGRRMEEGEGEEEEEEEQEEDDDDEYAAFHKT